MNKISKICGQTTAPIDPYSHRASRVESRQFWRWGGDNRLPQLLSAVSRCSTTHRRIINDKADYIAGKGLTCDASLGVVRQVVACANGSGETLRSIIARLALDEAMFGNAFMEVVTDSEGSFLSLYHVDASKCRLARDEERVVMHHDWSQFRASEAVSLPQPEPLE